MREKRKSSKKCAKLLLLFQIIFIILLAIFRPKILHSNNKIKNDDMSNNEIVKIEVDANSLSTLQIQTYLSIRSPLNDQNQCSSMSRIRTMSRDDVRDIQIGNSFDFICDSGVLSFTASNQTFHANNDVINHHINNEEDDNIALFLRFDYFSENFQSNLSCSLKVEKMIASNIIECTSFYIYTQYNVNASDSNDVNDHQKYEIFSEKAKFNFPSNVGMHDIVEFLEIEITFSIISISKCPEYSFPCGRNCCIA